MEYKSLAMLLIHFLTTKNPMQDCMLMLIHLGNLIRMAAVKIKIFNNKIDVLYLLCSVINFL